MTSLFKKKSFWSSSVSLRRSFWSVQSFSSLFLLIYTDIIISLFDIHRLNFVTLFGSHCFCLLDFLVCSSFTSSLLYVSPQWVTADVQIIMSDSVGNPELLKVLPLEPGVGQNVALHALPTAGDLFLMSTFPILSVSFSSVSSPKFFSCVKYGQRRIFCGSAE